METTRNTDRPTMFRAINVKTGWATWPVDNRDAAENCARQEWGDDAEFRIEQSHAEQTETPGRWTTEGGLIFADDKRAYVGQVDGDIETARIAGMPTRSEYARLICAAVNATREAGYTVEELEGGMIKQIHDALNRRLEISEHEAERAKINRANLAACREALRALVDAVTPTPGPGDEWADYPRIIAQARALLARLAASA